MAENKSGCFTWIIILLVLGTILGAVEKCSHKHHKRQELIIPEYACFTSWSGDPIITFQTFGDNRKDLACLNYEWESGQMAEMYVVIKNGNDLYDGTDSFVGYIVVRKDGTFDIKGSKTANGHYVGLDDAKMSYRGKKAATSKAKKKKDKANRDDDEGDTLDWLDGIWMATNTPVGDAIFIIKGNSITEKIDDVTHKGEFTIGEDYLQVRYDEGLGVRLDLDRNKKRIGLGEGWWLSREGEKTGKKDPLQNDDEAIEFLKQVYPNSIDGSFTGDKLCTDRFAEYSKIECEYDPIYQTQDCYSAAVLPNPAFSKYSKVENAYTVQWQRYEHLEKVTVIVVLKKEEGRWLIDNIVVEDDRLLFDYTKPPVSIYADF